MMTTLNVSCGLVVVRVMIMRGKSNTQNWLNLVNTVLDQLNKAECGEWTVGGKVLELPPNWQDHIPSNCPIQSVKEREFRW